MDFTIQQAISPVLGASDIERALEADPYSDDLLAAAVIFHQRANDGQADKATERMHKADPLFRPDGMK